MTTAEPRSAFQRTQGLFDLRDRFCLQSSFPILPDLASPHPVRHGGFPIRPMPDVVHGKSQEEEPIRDDRCNNMPTILSPPRKMKLKIDIHDIGTRGPEGEDCFVGGKRSKGAWCKPRQKWMMGALQFSRGPWNVKSSACARRGVPFGSYQLNGPAPTGGFTQGLAVLATLKGP